MTAAREERLAVQRARNLERGRRTAARNREKARVAAEREARRQKRAELRRLEASVPRLDARYARALAHPRLEGLEATGDALRRTLTRIRVLREEVDDGDSR